MKEVTKATIEGRVRATGNGFAFFVPKALLDCNVLEGGKIYKIEVKEVLPISAPDKKVQLDSTEKKKEDARCGIASLVLPEHPELVLFRPVRAMSRSLLWDAPVFEQVIDVEA